MGESTGLAVIYIALHYIFTVQVYLGGCDKPVSPLMRRAAVSVKARSSVFIETQELSHFITLITV